MIFKWTGYEYKVIRVLGEDEDIDYFIHYVNEYLLKGDNIFDNMATFLDNLNLTKGGYMTMLRNEMYQKLMVNEYKNLLNLGFKAHKDTIARLNSL